MTDTNHLEGALQQLLQERAELDSVIAALQKRLGKPVTSDNLIPPAKPLRSATGAVSADSVVYRGAFFNLSVPKAAQKLLKITGRPLKTPEILSAFLQAGYEMKGDNARSGIYTALARSKDFVKVLPDTWDLAERHPEAAEQKMQELTTAKNKKAKKGGRAAKQPAAAKAELKPQAMETKVA
jgi:hypothetical protein